LSTKCLRCNAENPDTQKFCGECGAKLKPIENITVTQTRRSSYPSSTIAAKYQILGELGKGGMGIVYKAKDIRLDRTVALKFLSEDLTKDEEAKQRFILEAKAAAALNHPRICTIYEIGEAEDQSFIAIEYIEGQSLKDKLKFGPLDIDDAKHIAIQVAEGLREAHTKGIIHRDIKPANIMLADKEQAKIMDFGLAKISAGTDLTKPSTIMGTVAYMSPEQARGEQVDHRTDIWSLGAMLYEMITGERPFQRGQEHALIFAILNDKPMPLSLLRSEVPAQVEQVVNKALEKKASQRYQNIQDMIRDLGLSINLPKTEKSLVVLPFDDLSPKRDNEYFSDGLTEEIISDLSLIHDLLVISRSSAMTYKGTQKKIKEIGKELNVQYVLEGSVRKAGNNLRITAQLIDATNDAHIWAGKYSGTLDDVFDIQEKVSRSIVDTLKLELNPEEDRKIAERPIEDVKAYEYYLKARNEYWRLNEESLKRAQKFLEEGMEIAGENDLLYTALGWIRFQYVSAGIDVDESHLTKAEEYAQKALALNPISSYAYGLMGAIHEQKGNIQEAAKNLKKAVEINPNNTEALMMLAFVYAIAGKGYAARPVAEHLMNIDSFTPSNHFSPIFLHMSEGQFDLALKSCRRAYELDSQNPAILFCTSWTLAFNKLPDELQKIVEMMNKKCPDTVLTQAAQSLQYALQEEKQKIHAVITEDFLNLARTDHIFSYVLADCFALIGEKENALDWLETAVKNGRIDYPFISEYDPLLENIRKEPRFQKFMQHVKQKWANFDV